MNHLGSASLYMWSAKMPQLLQMEHKGMILEDFLLRNWSLCPT